MMYADLPRVLLSNFKTGWISLCLFFLKKKKNVVSGRLLKMNKNHEIAFFENRTSVCVRGREGEERERGKERREKERRGGEWREGERGKPSKTPGVQWGLKCINRFQHLPKITKVRFMWKTSPQKRLF